MKYLIVSLVAIYAAINGSTERKCKALNYVLNTNIEVLPFQKQQGKIFIINKLDFENECLISKNEGIMVSKSIPDSINIYYDLDSINTYMAFGEEDMAFGVYFSDARKSEVIEFLLLMDESEKLTIVNVKSTPLNY